MSRAERRREAAIERKTNRRWEQGIQRFSEQAGGLASIEIIRRGQGRYDTALPLADWARQARDQPGGLPCLCCQTGLSMRGNQPAAFLLVRRAPGPTATSLCCAVCARCATQPGEALIDGAFAYLEMIFPGLRTINAANVHPAGGTA